MNNPFSPQPQDNPFSPPTVIPSTPSVRGGGNPFTPSPTPNELINGPPEAPGALEKIANFAKNTARAIGVVAGDNDAEMSSALAEGYEVTKKGNLQAINDLENMFARDSVQKFAGRAKKYLEGKQAEYENDPTGSTLSNIGSTLSMPFKAFAAIGGIANNIEQATTGVDFTQDTPTPLSPADHAGQVKELIGNAVGAVIAPVAEEAVGAGVKMVLADEIATAANAGDVGTLMKAAQATKLGKIGVNILKDATAAGAAGMAQGAISKANQEDTVTGLLSGLAFAPIGIISGTLRGWLGKEAPEIISLRQQAAAEGIKRQFEAIGNSGIATVSNRLGALLNSNTLDEAVAKGTVLADPKAVGYLEGTTPETIARLKDYGINVVERNDKSGILFHGPEATIAPEHIADFKDGGNGLLNGNLVSYYGMHGKITNVRGADLNEVLVDMGEGFKSWIPVDELRQGDVQLRPGLVDKHLQSLYDDFQEHYDPDKPFADQITAFAHANQLDPHVTELTQDFGNRLLKQNASEPEVISQLNSLRKFIANKNAENTDIHIDDVVTSATSNGMYITNDGPAISIRSVDDGRLIGHATTLEDAQELINKSGQYNSLENATAGNMPVEGIPASGAPGGGMVNGQAQIQWRGRESFMGNIGKSLSGFDAQNPVLSSALAFAQGLDEHFNTKLYPRFVEAQTATRRIHAIISQEMNGKIMAPVRMYAKLLTEQELNHATTIMEALSEDEIRTGATYSTPNPMPDHAVKLGEFAAKNNVDLPRLLRFESIRKGIDARYLAQGMRGANEQYEREMLDISKISDDNLKKKYALDADANRRQSMADWRSDPAYKQEIKTLYDKYGPDVNGPDAQALDMVQAMKGSHEDLYAAIRLSKAISDPQNWGLSSAEQADRLNASPTLRHYTKVARRAYEYYNTSGSQAKGYVFHLRSLTDPLDEFGQREIVNSIENPHVRSFVGNMARTGEMDTYERNAQVALESYVRGSLKNEHYYPQLSGSESGVGIEGMLQKEIKGISDPNVREIAMRRTQEFMDSLTGKQTLSVKAAKSLWEKVLQNKGYSPEEILRAKNAPGGVDTLLNWTTSSLIGARPELALRDMVDVTRRYYILHGLAETFKMLTTPVSDQAVLKMTEEGLLNHASYADFWNPAEAYNSFSSRVNKASKWMADTGFKVSGQDWAYLKMQSHVILRTMNRVDELWNQHLRGEISKQEVFDKLFMNSHDEQTFKQFNAYLEDNNTRSAGRFLARAEADRTVGVFGLGNASAGAKTFAGRLFNQMGQYTIANRSNMVNMVTRGTNKEVTRSLWRLAHSEAAVLAAGKAVGFDVSRWSMLPNNWLFTGGPLVTAAGNFGKGSGQVVEGSDSQGQYAKQQMARDAIMFVPFGYSLRDLYGAYKLGTQGSGYYLRVPAQAAGFNVSINDRSWMDMLTNNYPVAPEGSFSPTTAAYNWMREKFQ